MKMNYSSPQLPKTTASPMRMATLNGCDTNGLFNPEVNQFNYRPVMMKTSERSHYFTKPEKNPIVPRHPLDRYSSAEGYTGYYDPNWESLEYDRLQFRGNLPRAIKSGAKVGYNVLVDAFGEHEYKTYDEDRTWKKLDQHGNRLHQFELNNDKGRSFDGAYNGIHEENRYSLNEVYDNNSYKHRLNDPNLTTRPLNAGVNPSFTSIGYNSVSLSDKPLYPEIYPYIQREGVNGSSGRFHPRTPAGANFANLDLIRENVKRCDINDQGVSEGINDSCAVLSKKEMFDIRNSLRHNKRGLGGGRTVEAFENPIASDADYMYMSALKVRANAVCQYLKNNEKYSSWAKNWRMLEKNLNGGKLFERLSETDADVAFVVNKGDEIKFRIRDTTRYIPINTYQYVLYHEMAHMSTEELQHTEFFMKLLNIISLAGFECGFIDFQKLPRSFYLTDGKPILCRDSMKEEVCAGAEWLKQANPNSALYYDGIISAVKSA